MNAKEAPDQGDEKDESKEKIANGINPEVYLGKTFRNCETLSQFVHGFERREHVPAPIRRTALCVFFEQLHFVCSPLSEDSETYSKCHS